MSEQQQLMQARQLIADKQYDAAKAILRELPNNATAQEWLAKMENVPSDETRAFLERAQELIKQRKFAEARAVLSGIADNPTAQKWLAQIDQAVAAAAGSPITPLGGASASDDAPIAPLTGTPTPIRDPGARPATGSAVADSLRASVDTSDADSRREQVEQVMGQMTGQVTSALIAANVDLSVGRVALVVAVVTGLLAALLDRILGMPGILLFTFGGFAALINGPVYAQLVLRKSKQKAGETPSASIDLAAIIVAVAAGLVVELVWYLVMVIIVGSPKGSSSHSSYRYWFKNYTNFFKALITGPILGLLGLGWYWLVPRLPGDMAGFQAMLPGRGDSDKA